MTLPRTPSCSVALRNWLAGGGFDFARFAFHVPVKGLTAGAGPSTCLFSWIQLAKPYWRASACCASASLPTGRCCCSVRRSSLASFFRYSRLGRSGRARCTTPPFATRPLVGRMKVWMLGYAQSTGGIIPSRGRDATCLAWGILQHGHFSGQADRLSPAAEATRDSVLALRV